MKPTIPEVAAQIAAMIAASGIYSKRPTASEQIVSQFEFVGRIDRRLNSVLVGFEQAFGIDASINLRDMGVEEKTRRGLTYKVLTFKAELNQSACTMDIAGATAKATLLRRVIELASLIDASFNGIEIES